MSRGFAFSRHPKRLIPRLVDVETQTDKGAGEVGDWLTRRVMARALLNDCADLTDQVDCAITLMSAGWDDMPDDDLKAAMAEAVYMKEHGLR